MHLLNLLSIISTSSLGTRHDSYLPNGTASFPRTEPDSAKAIATMPDLTIFQIISNEWYSKVVSIALQVQ